MTLVSSNMMPLGSQAPDFNLQDTVSGNYIALNDVKSDTATVIMFICNHCPYVKHIETELALLANEYSSKGISFVAICANDANNYPEDSPEKMKETAERLGYTFPYLHDATQEIAKAYHAACTPDFFVFDNALQCVYRGQFDNSSPGSHTPVTGESIRAALDAISQGHQIDPNQTPSMGCSIKWS